MNPSIAQRRDLYLNSFVYPEIYAKALDKDSTGPTSSIICSALF